MTRTSTGHAHGSDDERTKFLVSLSSGLLLMACQYLNWLWFFSGCAFVILPSQLTARLPWAHLWRQLFWPFLELPFVWPLAMTVCAAVVIFTFAYRLIFERFDTPLAMLRQVADVAPWPFRPNRP